MKYCQRCNRNFQDTTNFCESCGGSLSVMAPIASNIRYCPNCGADVQPEWRFCTHCRTELPTPPAQTFQFQSSNVNTPPPMLQPTTASNRIFVRCRSCKNLVEENATVCDKCGANMIEDSATLPVQPPAPAPPPRAVRHQVSDPAETWTQGLNSGGYVPSPSATTYIPPKTPAPSTSKIEKSAPTLGMFEAYAETTPQSQSSKWPGLIALGAILLTLAAVMIWYWWPKRGAVPQSTSQDASSSGVSSTASTTSSTPSAPAPQPKASTSPVTSSADDEVKEIRQRRIAASPSEANQIIATITEAEKKYPNDYRFPYERAKLSIKGIVSHHEAFDALFTAAEKAIDEGKADDMLSSLETDKDGDFYKLSRGHREWATLAEALRNKDKSTLKVVSHH